MVGNSLVGFGKYKSKSFEWVVKNDLDFFINIKKLYYKKFTAGQKQNYNYFYKKYVSEKYNKPELVEECVSLLKERKTLGEIHEIMLAKIDLDTLRDVMIDANLIIKKEFARERDYLLDLHLLRYEEMFNENWNYEVAGNVPVNYRNAILLEKYTIAMETLFQKEKLLGIHSKKFKLHRAKITDRSDIDYDVKKLTFDEQKELLALINKAKYKEILVNTINEENNNPLNIEDAVIIEETIIEAPVQLIPETNKIEEERQRVIEKTGKTLDEIKDKINLSLEEKIKLLFEKKKNK